MAARSKSPKARLPPVWQLSADAHWDQAFSMAALMSVRSASRLLITCACMPMPAPMTLFTTISLARLA